MALVAVIATVLLRRPSWEPPRLAAPLPASAPSTIAAVAKVQPTQEVKVREVSPPAAPQAPSAVASKAEPPAKAPEPTTVKAAEKPAEKAPATATQAAAVQADKVITPAAAASPTAAPKAAAVQATPTSVPAPTAALALARIQESGVATAAGKAGPEPFAAAAPAALVQLPANTALSYADMHTLWALDPDGVHALATADGISTPMISEDRAWVVYRLAKGNNVEIWAVPWSGGDAKPLLSEHELNSELPQGYRERRIQDVRWAKRMLVVTTLTTPATADTLPSLELWRVDVDSGSRQLLASTDARYRPIAAPDGAEFAFFRREPDKAADGSLRIISADGAAERIVLRFPVWPDQRAYDGQISWLPDSSVVWAAIPDSGLDRSQRLNGLTLYRAPVKGDAQPVAHIDASEAHWSPDGVHLAYVRLASDASGPRELYLATADGANPQLYATTAQGRFIGWSPGSAYFLYEDGGQLMLGAPGQKAQRLATGATEPRWVGSGQILYLADGAQGWVLHGVDGKMTSLASLPVDATLDSIAP